MSKYILNRIDVWMLRRVFRKAFRARPHPDFGITGIYRVLHQECVLSLPNGPFDHELREEFERQNGFTQNLVRKRLKA